MFVNLHMNLALIVSGGSAYRVRIGDSGTGITLLELVLDLLYNPFKSFVLQRGAECDFFVRRGAASWNDKELKSGAIRPNGLN